MEKNMALLLHNDLRNRLECTGLLILDTALHIGTGQNSPTTDAGVVRDYRGRPFIPGSSLKGALRSAVERRVKWLGLTSCQLTPGNDSCLSLTADKELMLDDGRQQWRALPLAKRKQDIEKDLCDTCKVFGSPVFAAKVRLDDLPIVEDLEELAASLVEVRDGVGIDRDSGTAADGAKFDYEVVASLTAFRFFLSAENLEPPQFALLSIGLLEMMNGAVPIGGKVTRGLGHCRLLLPKVYYVDFPQGDALTLAPQLLDYLRPSQERENGWQADPRVFLVQQVQNYIEERRRAQAARE
jgi:CRISPR-associated RAMP protein (TIGR02581 family)